MAATDLPVEVVRQPLTCNVRGAASLQIEDKTEIQQPARLIPVAECYGTTNSGSRA